MMSRKPIFRMMLFIGLCLLTFAVWGASAQETTPEPTVAPINLIGVEPSVVQAGAEVRLSIIGNNFTPNTTVRVWNVGFLTTTYINPTALTAVLPANVPNGVYVVEVSDPLNGVANLPNALTVISAPLPPPTPIIIPTMPPEPGEPSLVVQGFSVSPSIVNAGGLVTLRFDVINRGSRLAQGISVAIEAGASISPAPGQANALIPDLFPNAVANATLGVLVASSAPGGALNVPIKLTYRDQYGTNYTATATLSVTVSEDNTAPQLMLARYLVTPSQARAGESVTVEVIVTNNGTGVANQLMLKVNGGGVLLPGSQGDTFSYGDLTAGGTASFIMPLIIATDAKAGVQAQTVSLTYIHGGEEKKLETSFTMTIVASVPREPSLLVSAYDAGTDVLAPGDRFTLNITLSNVGEVGADGLFVTFGTVEAPSEGGSGSGSSTTPSTVFAPLETGGTLYVGRIETDGTVDLTQNFIVNGTTASGVYSLPVTLRYRTPSKTDPVQTNLRISLIVISPPKLQITHEAPLPDVAEIGSFIPLAMVIKNIGTKNIEIPSIVVSVDGGDLADIAEFTPGVIAKDATSNISTGIIPTQAGTMIITVTFSYIDDLNAPRDLVYTYEVEISEAPPMPEDRDFDFVPDDFDACPDEGDNGFGVDPTGCPNPPTPIQPPTEEPQADSDLLGRFILGLLGLGS